MRPKISCHQHLAFGFLGTSVQMFCHEAPEFVAAEEHWAPRPQTLLGGWVTTWARISCLHLLAMFRSSCCECKSCSTMQHWLSVLLSISCFSYAVLMCNTNHAVPAARKCFRPPNGSPKKCIAGVVCDSGDCLLQFLGATIVNWVWTAGRLSSTLVGKEW